MRWLMSRIPCCCRQLKKWLLKFLSFSLPLSTYIPANFFWDISVRFSSWECWDFLRRHDHFRRFPKMSEVFRRRPKSAEVCQRRARSQCFSLQKSEIARKVLSFIHFTHGFRSLHGSELTYFWKLCQARRQQLTFFNQAWEIGPQAWDRSFQPAGVRLTPKAWELPGIHLSFFLKIKPMSTSQVNNDLELLRIPRNSHKFWWVF